jgi:hypothetical protein
MSEQQLVKIQILEKQLQEVNEHPGANNIKKTPAFIHENRLSNGSLRKSLATITPRSDVKRVVLSTPRLNNCRIQGELFARFRIQWEQYKDHMRQLHNA